MALSTLAGVLLAPGSPTPIADASAYRTRVSLCDATADQTGRNGCITEATASYASSAGPDAALTALMALLRADSLLRDGCHQLSHQVGRQLYRELGENAIVPGQQWCNWGYYHGIMQEFAAPDVSGLAEFAMRLCSDIEASGVPDGGCVHGIGHASFAALADVEEALAVCVKVPTYMVSTCSDGVIMEAVDSGDAGLAAVEDLGMQGCVDIPHEGVATGCVQGVSQALYDGSNSLTTHCAIVPASFHLYCKEGFASQVASTLLSIGRTAATDSCGVDKFCAWESGRYLAFSLYDYGLSEQACALLTPSQADCLDGVQTVMERDAVTSSTIDPASDSIVD